MRKIFCLHLALLIFICSSQSQSLRSVLPANLFSDNISKVVADFRNNYRNIQGDKLPPEGDMDVYKSNVGLPGSIMSVIYRFHSELDSTASWQSIMFQGEEYSSALKVYKNTSRLLNKSRIALGNNSTVGFSGKFNDPETNISFANSTFKLNSDEPAYENFVADIELINTGYESWEVRLNLHNKKKDEEK